MSHPPRTVSIYARRTGLALLALAALTVLGLVFAHLPPVRQAVLRYAERDLQARFGVGLTADRLDYNLATLSIGLSNVRVAADRSPALPFFRAASLTVSVTPAIFRGRLAFGSIHIDSGAFDVVRTAAGINLPTGRGGQGAGGEPAAFLVGRLQVPRLAVTIRDEVSGVSITAPSVAIDLSPTSGRLQLNAPALVTVGSHTTRVSQLAGGASFDGRTLRLAALQLRSDEAALAIDGTIGLLVREPRLNLQLRGTTDAERLAGWVAPGADLPRATLSLAGAMTGPLSQPALDVQVSASTLAWRRLGAEDLRARVTLGGDTVRVSDGRLRLAGGDVSAAATLPLDGAAGNLQLSWSDLDSSSVMNALLDPGGIVIAGRSSGSLTAQAPLNNPAAGRMELRVALAPAPNGRRRVALPGTTRLRVADRGWRAEGRHLVANIAPASFALEGELGAATAPIGAGSLRGAVTLTTFDVPAALAAMRAVGVIDVAEGVVTKGTASAGVAVSGRLGAPQIDADATVRELAAAGGSQSGAIVSSPVLQLSVIGRPFEPALAMTVEAGEAVVADQPVADLRIGAGLTGGTLTVETATARQPDDAGVLDASGTFDTATSRYTFTGRLSDWRLRPSAALPLSGVLAAELAGMGLDDGRGRTGGVGGRARMPPPVGRGSSASTRQRGRTWHSAMSRLASPSTASSPASTPVCPASQPPPRREWPCRRRMPPSSMWQRTASIWRCWPIGCNRRHRSVAGRVPLRMVKATSHPGATAPPCSP